GRAEQWDEHVAAAGRVDRRGRIPTAARSERRVVGRPDKLVQEPEPLHADVEPRIPATEVVTEHPDVEILRAEADGRAGGAAAARQRQRVASGRVERLVARDDVRTVEPPAGRAVLEAAV